MSRPLVLVSCASVVAAAATATLAAPDPRLPRDGADDCRAARAEAGRMFRDVDAAIMMPGANPSHPAYLAMQDWLKDDLAERRGRRTIHFHWVEAGSASPPRGNRDESN